MAYAIPLSAPTVGAAPSAGGAPTDFSPDQVQGLAAWYTADVGVYSDAGVTPATSGGLVQQWNDRSGNGRHLIQLTSGLRPSWTSLSVLINRQPFVQFASGKLMQALFTLEEPQTVYLVHRVAVPVTGNYSFDGGVGNNSMAVLIGTPTTSRQMRKNLVDAGLLVNFNPRGTAWSASAYCFDGANSSASVTAINASPAGNPGTNADTGGITLGARADGTLPTNGSFAEVIVYQGQRHDITTQNRIGSYLRQRYAF